METQNNKYIDELEKLTNGYSELTEKAITLSEKRKTQAKEFKRHADALAEALEPFAHFIEQWSRKPIRSSHDIIHGIHTGDECEAFIRRSHCQRALDALTNYRSRDDG